MLSRRIAVLGAGANGASIGADLTRAGLNVTLIEQWPSHVEAMRSKGVRINLPDEVQQVPVRVIHLCEVATLNEQFDIVLMLMKAYDSRWAARLIEPYLKPDGLLVGVQNGMTVDAIADEVGMERTLGCVIELSSMMFEPGVVERHSAPDRTWFAVGALNDATVDRVKEIAELLSFVGTVEISENIRAAKWMKLVSNACTLVPTGIIGLPLIEANAIPEMRAFMLASGQEALSATLALGNPILPIFGLTTEVVNTETVVEILLDTLMEGFVLPNTKTTVLQDWIKGRRSEVDDLNGLVSATHRALGGWAPANEAVVEFAHRIERKQLDPQISNLTPLLKTATAFGHVVNAP
jgi:2-dehydropantoate 2-reductase